MRPKENVNKSEEEVNSSDAYILNLLPEPPNPEAISPRIPLAIDLRLIHKCMASLRLWANQGDGCDNKLVDDIKHQLAVVQLDGMLVDDELIPVKIRAVNFLRECQWKFVAMFFIPVRGGRTVRILVPICSQTSIQGNASQ